MLQLGTDPPRKESPSHACGGSAAELLQAASRLAPRIEAEADRIEADRRVPAELLDALIEAGMFRLLLASELGGYELDLPTHIRIIELLARADASVAWCVGQANGLLNYIAYAEPNVVRALFADRRTVLANGPGEGNRPGSATPVEGGYRISGKWMFASGIMQATWLLAICDLAESPGQQRLMLIPKSSAQVHDVWHVSGLRGTGSQSFSVEDLFVPADHAIHYTPECRRQPGRLYLFTNNGIFGPSFASVALGTAHTALQSIVDFAAGKIPRGMERTIRENAVVQSSVALAHARLGAARSYLHQTLEDVWSAVSNSGVLSIEQQVAVRLAATHATHESAAVVDAVYTLAGSNAIFEDKPFERRFRDVHAVTQQLQGRRAHYEHAGAYLLGLEPNTSFL